MATGKQQEWTAEQQAEEKLLIQRAYRSLLQCIKSKMDEEDKKNIRGAYELAVKAHSKQRRKSGEPYILHPIAVAQICAEEIGLGPTAIVSALLHDVVEDTEVTLEDIEIQFGNKIAKIVDGLTKLDKSFDAESPQAENFKKVLSTLVEDVRVVLIKMADRLHNMRTLGAMPRHKQLKIASETEFIYAPLAHRLGLYAFKTEFQDLSMKIREPDTYHDIAKKLQETKASRNKYIQQFIEPIKKELGDPDTLGFPFEVYGRPKSIFSISNKIKKKQVAFEEIYDLFAVRIVVKVPPKKEKPACWVVYSTVTDIYKPIPERLKDWITTPKSNGYESLHTTVIGPHGRFVEVQIRSQRMDEIAERGFAAHWKYKGISAQPDVFDRWLGGVRDLLDDKDSDALEFLSDFKTNYLFKEEVYVFTPNGDMRILPKGATALDFAFDIHTQVGYHATAIKINNKLVPMGYKLQNGDQVHVTTNKSQKPSEAWLKWVITGKARSKIRSSMKEERRKQGGFGKEALERKLRNMKVDFEDGVDVLVKYFKYKSRVDLYYDISVEVLDVSDLSKHFNVEAGKLVEIIEEKSIVAEPQSDTPNRPRKAKPVSPKSIIINGQIQDQFKYELATCCNPVQGDDIFAYMSSKGCKIHRSSCPNSTHLLAKYGYRIMKAEWAKTFEGTSFVADLIITGIDSGRGVIQTLSDKISNSLGLDIRAFQIEGNEGYFEGRIKLMVANKDQLNIAIKSLLDMENIQSVTRVG